MCAEDVQVSKQLLGRIQVFPDRDAHSFGRNHLIPCVSRLVLFGKSLDFLRETTQSLWRRTRVWSSESPNVNAPDQLSPYLYSWTLRFPLRVGTTLYIPRSPLIVCGAGSYLSCFQSKGTAYASLLRTRQSGCTIFVQTWACLVSPNVAVDSLSSPDITTSPRSWETGLAEPEAATRSAARKHGVHHRQ